MTQLPQESVPRSARRQRYRVVSVPDGLVNALQTKFRVHKLAPEPMALRLLAQQLLENNPTLDVKKLQDLKRLADIGYRMVVPYSYAQLQREILPRYAQMKDMDEAAARLANAVEHGEQIGISGDYDCDGNCSTALMVRFLQESGVPAPHIHVHIPNRVKEGYGVNSAAVEAMASQQPPVTFLLTLDNGTTANKPIAVACDKQMEVVVIDHHPNSEGHPLPPGALVVNPKRSDESAAIREDANGAPDLAAVGVTWLVARRAAQMLAERGYYQRQQLPLPDSRRWLGLVAMATIGDVVSLNKPLNHALVSEGLKLIHENGDPYISTLARVAGLREPEIAKLSESDVAFKLAPIINAPGRLGQSVAWAFLSSPEATAELLVELEEDVKQGRDGLAVSLKKLSHGRANMGQKDYPEPVPSAVSQGQYALMMLSDEANELRKKVGGEVTRQAQKQARAALSANPNLGALLLAGEDWHEGVVGIVAGRIKEEFGLPTMVASINRERGLCKASARNILGGCGDIGQVLRDMCEKDHVLSKAGGHPMAAGASFNVSQLDAARAKLEEHLGTTARKVNAARRAPLAAAIDLREAVGKGRQAMTPTALLQQFTNAQEALRPHGQGREKPRVALYGGQITNLRYTSSSRQHLLFSLQLPGSNGETIACSAFHTGGSQLDEKLHAGLVPDDVQLPVIIGTLELQEAAGHASPTLAFYVEDLLNVPRHFGKDKQAIAAALGASQAQLLPIIVSALCR